MQTNLDGLGQRLKQLRIERGLGVAKLARYADLGANTLRQIECGNTNYPSIFTLAALADFYEMTLDDLVGREVSKKRDL